MFKRLFKGILCGVFVIGIALALAITLRNQNAPKLRFVAESQPCKAVNCFESVSHYRYLYEGDTKISPVGTESLSPSGTYVAFEDDGKIMLYKRGSGKLTEITDDNFAVPEFFNWNESQHELTITYYNDNSDSQFNNHPKSVIQLD